MATSAHDPAALAYFEFIEEFRRESDRAAVVLGAAKLDLLLYQLFQAVLLPCAASKDVRNTKLMDTRIVECMCGSPVPRTDYRLNSCTV